MIYLQSLGAVTGYLEINEQRVNITFIKTEGLVKDHPKNNILLYLVAVGRQHL